MELKLGYKQTEVGIIPNDWDVVSIGSLITDYRGGASLEPSDFTSSGVKVLPKGGVGKTGWLNVEESDQKFCSPAYAAANYRNQVDETYTIVVLRDLVPSGPAIGLIVQIRDKETYVLAQGVYGFKVNKSVVSGYLVHLSNTRWYRKLINSIMVGSTQVHITNTAFKRAQIPLPPLPEQEAIAETLSDADALIEALKQLIAKKCQVKQGAMQELLTGKRRLPGFSEKWVMKKLGDVCNRITTGKLDANAMKENGEYRFYTCAKEYYQIDTYAFDTEALLVSGNGANVGYIHYYKGKFNAYQRTYVLSEFSEDIFFIKLFMDQYFQKRIKVEVNAGNTPYIKMDTLSEMEIHLPNTKEEQTAIAEILSDMDAEIAALDEKLVKARQVKQGMMQELLTGKIRLV